MSAALDLAALGLHVLPLHYPVGRPGSRLACSCGNPACDSPAKHPYPQLAPKGLHNATRDPAIVARWFGHGAPYNCGIRTGQVSGIVVIDVDPRHGGGEALALLERSNGPLPPTWRFLTGGGGEHIVLRHPGGTIPNSAGLLGPGLDVRGDGGYIVAPPSRHISGRHYAVSVDHHPDDVPLADMPAWLTAKLTAAKTHAAAATMPETWRQLVADGVAEGRRNDAVARLAGHLLRKGVDPYVALDLVRIWNAARCRPPLTEPEVINTVELIAARECRRREAPNG